MSIVNILAEHTIECTGIAKVTCRGCRNKGWMNRRTYRAHLADLICDDLVSAEAVEAVARTVARGRRGADAKVNDTDRWSACGAIAALVETIGGK